MLRRSHVGIGRVAVPVRALLQRFGLFVLLALSVTTMVVSEINPEAAQRVRMAVVAVAAPVLDALSRPVDSANQLIGEAAAFFALRSENAALRETVARLEQWQAAARQLERENAALRGLLNYRPAAGAAFAAARVIGDSGSAFVRTKLVNAGAADGVARGQAAVTGRGLAGRVVEVGRRAARILLITDLNSRIPVLVQSTRQPAVLAGDNGPIPTLAFLPPNAAVGVGDRIVTSGHGGVLPPGLPVGVVTSVEGSSVRVRPAADLARLEHVRLVAVRPPVLEPLPSHPGRSAAP